MIIYKTEIDLEIPSYLSNNIEKYIPKYTTDIDRIYRGLCDLVSIVGIDESFYIFGQYIYPDIYIKNRKVTVYRSGINPFPYVVLSWEEAPIMHGKEPPIENELPVGEFRYLEKTIYINISKVNVDKYAGKSYSLCDCFFLFNNN